MANRAFNFKNRFLVGAIVVLLVFGVVAAAIYAAAASNQEDVMVIPVKQADYGTNAEYDNVTDGVISTGMSQTVAYNADKLVEEIPVEVGDHVSKGDILVKYDTTQARLNLEQEQLDKRILEMELQEARDTLAAINGARQVYVYDEEDEDEDVESEEEEDEESEENEDVEEEEDEESDDEARLEIEDPASGQTVHYASKQVVSQVPIGEATPATPDTQEDSLGDAVVSTPTNTNVGTSSDSDTTGDSSSADEKEKQSSSSEEKERKDSSGGVIDEESDQESDEEDSDKKKKSSKEESDSKQKAPAQAQETPAPAPAPQTGRLVWVDAKGDEYTESELRRSRVEAESDIRGLTTDIAEAELKVKKAQQALENNIETAEINGVVTEVDKSMVGVGMAPANLSDEGGDDADQKPSLGDGNALVKVSSFDGLYVETAMNEWALAFTHVGDTVYVTDWSSGGIYPAKITHISEYASDYASTMYAMDDTSDSYFPYTALINEDGLDLEDGDSVEVSLTKPEDYEGDDEEDDNTDPIYLYKAFVVSEGPNRYVYMEDEDGKLKKQKIEVSGQEPETYIVTGGITRKDFIAFPFGDAIREGANVFEGDIDDLYEDY